MVESSSAQPKRAKVKKPSESELTGQDVSGKGELSPITPTGVHVQGKPIAEAR